MHRNNLTRLLLAVIAVLLVWAPASDAQSRRSGPPQGGAKNESDPFEYFDPNYGRATVQVPEETEAGEWDGSWFYVNRDYRFLLWFRTVDGQLQHRMQVFSLSAPEQFRTDWQGVADYDVNGAPGEFRLELPQTSDSQLSGTWYWDLAFSNSSRTESGSVTLNRAGDGRRIVMRFDPFRREIRRFDKVNTVERAQIMTFVKASKRLIIWDELF